MRFLAKRAGREEHDNAQRQGARRRPSTRSRLLLRCMVGEGYDERGVSSRNACRALNLLLALILNPVRESACRRDSD